MQAVMLALAMSVCGGQVDGGGSGFCWSCGVYSPSYRRPLAWNWNYLYGCGAGGIHCQRCRRDWLGPEFDYRRDFDYAWHDPNRGWPNRLPSYGRRRVALPGPGYYQPGYWQAPLPEMVAPPELVPPPGEELIEARPGESARGARPRVIHIRRQVAE